MEITISTVTVSSAAASYDIHTEYCLQTLHTYAPCFGSCSQTVPALKFVVLHEVVAAIQFPLHADIRSWDSNY